MSSPLGPPHSAWARPGDAPNAYEPRARNAPDHTVVWSCFLLWSQRQPWRAGLAPGSKRSLQVERFANGSACRRPRSRHQLGKAFAPTAVGSTNCPSRRGRGKAHVRELRWIKRRGDGGSIGLFCTHKTHSFDGVRLCSAAHPRRKVAFRSWDSSISARRGNPRTRQLDVGQATSSEMAAPTLHSSQRNVYPLKHLLRNSKAAGTAPDGCRTPRRRGRWVERSAGERRPGDALLPMCAFGRGRHPAFGTTQDGGPTRSDGRSTVPWCHRDPLQREMQAQVQAEASSPKAALGSVRDDLLPPGAGR